MLFYRFSCSKICQQLVVIENIVSSTETGHQHIVINNIDMIVMVEVVRIKGNRGWSPGGSRRPGGSTRGNMSGSTCWCIRWNWRRGERQIKCFYQEYRHY